VEEPFTTWEHVQTLALVQVEVATGTPCEHGTCHPHAVLQGCTIQNEILRSDLCFRNGRPVINQLRDYFVSTRSVINDVWDAIVKQLGYKNAVSMTRSNSCCC
jgi:hypothetical protein